MWMKVLELTEERTVVFIANELHGPCTFRPFVCRRHSKTNCHSRKSIFHYLFGTSAPKREAEVKFHCPFWFPNRKVEVGIHYMYFVLELSLPKRKAELLELNFRFGTWMEKPSRLLTARFGTVAPSGKTQSEIPQFHYWTSHPNRNLDPRQKKKKMETLRTKFVYGWMGVVGGGRGVLYHRSCIE